VPVDGYVPWQQAVVTEKQTEASLVPSTGEFDGDLDLGGQNRPDLHAPPPAREEAPEAPNKPIEVLEKTNDADKIAGTLPLKIDLPKRGHRVVSNTFYVPASADLGSWYFYGHESFVLLLRIILMALLVVSG